MFLGLSNALFSSRYLSHSMKDFKTAEEMLEANGQAMTLRTSSASPETSDDEIEEDDNGIEISISRKSRFDKMEIISFAWTINEVSFSLLSKLL